MPSPAPLSISPAAARAFALAATGLIDQQPSVAATLDHLGFVQIDPLNVCGRMHEHILRHRVANYTEGDWHRHLYGVADDDPMDAATLSPEQRTAFEHFHPGRGVLAAFPLEAWPYFYAKMARRARTPGSWMGKLTAPEKRLAAAILDEIRTRGPLGSEHILDDTRASNGWNTSRLAKVVMDKLLGHGRLLISRRHRGRRIYDLPEHILPAHLLAQPPPRPPDIERWTTLLKLQQHRLVTLSRAELPHVIDDVQPLSIDDGGAPLYCLKADLPLLDSAIEDRLPPPPPPRLLAPLDPLIIDRALLQRLWNFDYTWEVYVPAAQRKRGYYALPLLAGDQFIGHVDLKADRPAGRLRVVSRRVARGHQSAPAVTHLAHFLGLK